MEEIHFSHKSVLLDECIEALNIREGLTYVDCTTGGGGHSLEIAKRRGKGGSTPLITGFLRLAAARTKHWPRSSELCFDLVLIRSCIWTASRTALPAMKL